jgi:hypothetical protein
MPAIQGGKKEPRLRIREAGKHITVAFLGHQRPDKGYQLVPAIVQRLRSRSIPVTVLVHNGDQEEVLIGRELREMAAADPDLIFEQRAADSVYWQELLDRSDVVALPYDPSRYRASYSAIAVEAASDGIPLVVPAGTTMETLAASYQGGGTTFAGWEADSICDAIEAAVADFENLGRRAFDGASEWRRANGVGCFVDRLMEAMPVSQTIAVARQHDTAKSVAMGALFDAFFAGTNLVVNGLLRVKRAYQLL